MTAVENPWLDVRLADYEGHMALPHVAQAQLLSDIFADLLARRRPRSVAVVGCAGGNGFERIDPGRVDRVVGIELNPSFVRAAEERFAGRFRSFSVVCADVEHDPIDVVPVDLLYAALILEYVDVQKVFRRLAELTAAAGVCAIVSQLRSDAIPEITPSPFTALAVLAERFHFVDSDVLRRIAASAGWKELDARTLRAAGGKDFRLQEFGRPR